MRIGSYTSSSSAASVFPDWEHQIKNEYVLQQSKRVKEFGD
jgi:hypothetical protein